MKRVVLALIFCMMISSLSAQTVTPTTSATTATTATATTVTEQLIPMPKTDRLNFFNSIKIDGPMNVVFERVESMNDVRITYDTKGCITSKFKFDIDRSGALVVSEKYDPKRTTVTDVTIYYNSLQSVKISHATAEFKDKLDRDLFDITVSGGATVSLAIETLDTAVECTGQSRLTISGVSKYLSMRVSTAKVDCSQLSTVATIVDASHSAEVRVLVSERLEVTTSTGAKLLYRGTPTILRNHAVLFGGDIININ